MATDSLTRADYERIDTGLVDLMTALDRETAWEVFGSRYEAALARTREKPLYMLTMDELLEASSLGSPDALYVASQTPPQVREEILRRLGG